MSIVLWSLQALLALLFTMGAVNQLFNYDKLARQFAVYRALPRAFWAVYGTVALLCVLGLIVTKVLPAATPIAAAVLAVQGSIFAALYVRYAGFRPSFLLWCLWTVGPVAMAAFVAYERFSAMAA